MLHTLIGYSARPDGIQALFYLAALAGIPSLANIVNNTNGAASLADTAAAARAVPKHAD